ncbi:winged helix-turn-helix domain-containing protein [Streptomyces collinus]|uniref:winged helix-turn-helix domain-containing protein n=1 Tax=Streptomyces collinus TaxID=42684 RepID=UPI003403676E
MRYAQGGGLTDDQRWLRQDVRVVATRRFAQGAPSSVIAKELSVSVRSVQRWRRAWIDEGQQGIHSKGPSSRPRLTAPDIRTLERELAKGPAVYGWPQQHWTLARVRTLIARQFHVTYTLQGVRKLLLRNGFCYLPPRTALPHPQTLSGWVKPAWLHNPTRADPHTADHTP